MRLAEGIEWAVHCLLVLSWLPPDAAIPAQKLAAFHGVPRPYLAKALQALARAGIVASATGRGGGYRLTRPAGEVTLLEIVRAIDGDEPLFRCTEIRQRAPIPGAVRPNQPPCAIAAAMQRAEAAWRAELARTTIADLDLKTRQHTPARVLQAGRRWIQEAATRRRDG